MAQIVGRNALQTNGLHKGRDFPRGSIGVTGRECDFLSLKQVCALKNLIRVLANRLLPKCQQMHLDTLHQRYGSDAARRFRLCHHYPAFLCVGNIPHDRQCIVLKIEVLPLKPQAFPAPDTCRSHQQHHTAVFQLASIQRTKKYLCLLLRQCLHWTFDSFRRVHLLDGVLFDGLLLLRIVEDNPQNVVMMLDALFGQRPSIGARYSSRKYWR